MGRNRPKNVHKKNKSGKRSRKVRSIIMNITTYIYMYSLILS